jgi:hypothetical protein
MDEAQRNSISDSYIERVCRHLQVAPSPSLRSGSLNRAREEAIRLIEDLRDALRVIERRADEVERTARAELERCLPNYTWPRTLTTEANTASLLVDPFSKFKAAAEAREAEVTSLFDETDRQLVETQRILAPGISSMKELESSLSEIDGVKFSYGAAGHQASVTLNTNVSHHRLTLKTDSSLRVIIDEYHSFSFDRPEPSENKKSFSPVDEAVGYIAESCGRHVGELVALKKHNSLNEEKPGG